MLAAAAFCPNPPLLVPELAQGAAAELDDLRSACSAALAELLGSDPQVVVVVGGGFEPASFGHDAVGSLAGYGVDVRAGTGAGVPVLTLPLTIGAWLLDRAGYQGPRAYAVVSGSGAGGPAPDPRRTAWLVLGDASACRTLAAPGSYDPRSADFDAEVTAALGSGDPAALTALDPGLAHELRVAGLGPWRALADAWGPQPAEARVLYDRAPYGVGYLVATWVRG